MGTDLHVHSMDELKGLSAKDLHSVLSKSAYILTEVESGFAEIAECERKIKRIEYLLGDPNKKAEMSPKDRRDAMILSVLAGVMFGYGIPYYIFGSSPITWIAMIVLCIPIARVVFPVLFFLYKMLHGMVFGTTAIMSKMLSAADRHEYNKLQQNHVNKVNEINARYNDYMDNIRVIPDKYRVSLILYKLCEYLEEGATDSWAGCIQLFKEDMNRVEETQRFHAIIDNLETIKTNSRYAAVFAGITAWNTRNL